MLQQWSSVCVQCTFLLLNMYSFFKFLKIQVSFCYAFVSSCFVDRKDMPGDNDEYCLMRDLSLISPFYMHLNCSWIFSSVSSDCLAYTRSWVQSPASVKLSVVVYMSGPGIRQEDPLRVILSYIWRSRPAWHTWDPPPTKGALGNLRHFLLGSHACYISETWNLPVVRSQIVF